MEYIAYMYAEVMVILIKQIYSANVPADVPSMLAYSCK